MRKGANAWGIEEKYEDAFGKWHRLNPESRSTFLEAMGVDPSSRISSSETPVKVVRYGTRISLGRPGELILENGTRLRIEKRLPGNIPPGYYRFEYFNGGHPIKIIVTPLQCYLPPDLRIWGWALQLYSLRSAKSWGIGDFGDLRKFARWSAGNLNSNVLLINPLHSATPGIPQNPSPYFPSSRIFRNLLYIAIEEVPGASEASAQIERFRSLGEALNREKLIRRDAIFEAKKKALELIWSRFRGDRQFENYVSEQGDSLIKFALFCALADQFGQRWSKWPQKFRHPNFPEVAHFAEENKDRIRFYEWIQWILDQQLARASKETGLMQDLAIGFDPEGADAWVWQDLLAAGIKVGAPPDEFNTQGQDWGLPPFIPHKLRAAGYEPFIQTLRATLRYGKGLRIDHVMGLFRLFWIPKGAGPPAGGYVRYPAEDLLGITALESHRAKAFVVGEDLGTVEKEVRQQLRRFGILSYRLLWFEKKKPQKFPRFAMAAVTTHDLPTIAGLWSGYDLQKQEELNLHPNVKGTRELKAKLAKWTGLPLSAPLNEVVARTYRLLSEAPSAIVTATLEDGLESCERPNMPGATGERPNWSLPLPFTLEKLEKHALVREVAKMIGRNRKATREDGPDDAPPPPAPSRDSRSRPA